MNRKSRDQIVSIINKAARKGEEFLDFSHVEISTVNDKDRRFRGEAFPFDWLVNELVRVTSLRRLKLAKVGLKKLSSEIRHLTNLVSLDISGNQIVDLPAEIGLLVNLTSLDISGNRLSDLPVEFQKLQKLSNLNLYENSFMNFPHVITKLINLTSLSIGRNNIADIPDEIGKLVNLSMLDMDLNEIRVLPAELGNLSKLKTLHLAINPIDKIPAEISKLVNLETLTLYGDNFTEMPKEVTKLTNLTFLDISENKISNIHPEIAQLQNLTKLDLRNNLIENLPREIHHLWRLKYLDLSKNKLTDLPFEIIYLTNLERLDLRDNLLNVPPEIVSNPEKVEQTLKWFELIGVDESFEFIKPLNECKVLFVGQGSVGKTSLIKRLIFNKFDPNETKTEGIFINRLNISGQHKVKREETLIQLNIWDFGGQEIMHATHQFFLTKRSLYLLVLDSRLTQEENRVEYWLKIIQSFGGESPVLVVGNKIDQHPLDIDRTGLQKKYPNIVGILETSAATGAGIETLKASITEQVNNLPHVRDLLPETWFTVKTKLEGLGQEKNFITHDKYLELCAENEISDETSQRTLIGFLHDLGVVLHFQDDPRLESLGILNPQWVTNGVYKILNSHELFNNKGVLTLAMLNEILNIDGYPRNKRLFIVDMMKKFELCYNLETDKSFLVPDLLPKDRPELKFNGIPAFEYAYPVLPSSVITRFIVRMNQKIDDGTVWRTGVLLKIGDNHALVKADLEDRKISIAIDGLEHTRRDALSAIRYQLDEIHTSIKGLDAQKRVPIPNAQNAEPLDYDYLLQLERDGFEELPVKDGNRLVKINVRQVLSGIESEEKRRDSSGRITNIYIGGDVKDSNVIAGDENALDTYNQHVGNSAADVQSPRRKK